jgi:molecular chaperone HscB
MESRSANYFDFFELDHKLDLDLKDLEKRFYALSRKWHPDMFARRSAPEQQEALDATAILNDGYRTLRDPVSRAEYLLKENGFDIGEQKSEFLEEVFELNMALESMRHDEVNKARAKFAAMRDQLDQDLHTKFQQYDASFDRNVLSEIRGMLNRRKYINNLAAP